MVPAPVVLRPSPSAGELSSEPVPETRSIESQLAGAFTGEMWTIKVTHLQSSPTELYMVQHRRDLPAMPSVGLPVI